MIKERDSVKIDYVGMVDNKVFDSTDEKEAKNAGIFKEKEKYEPITIIVGAGHVIKGLEKALVGKKKGDEFEVEIGPEEGFGKRDGGRIKLIPMTPFKRDKVKPYAGMVVNVDGAVGMVKSVSGGRVIVDFNHPLSGKKLKYKVWVRDLITDQNERLKELFKYHTGKDSEISGKEIVFSGEIPEFIKSKVFEDAKKHLGMDEIRFIEVWK
jgi:FKBP-type peptidyl-prolyl cis-trans isomerase 2